MYMSAFSWEDPLPPQSSASNPFLDYFDHLWLYFLQNYFRILVNAIIYLQSFKWQKYVLWFDALKIFVSFIQHY